MNECEQQRLELFPLSSFEDLLKNLNLDKILSIRKNNRMIRGWRVSIDTLSHRMVLTIPAAFDNAPVNIKKALINWAILPIPGNRHERKIVSVKRKELENYIRHYLHQSGILRPAITKIRPDALELKTKGIVYDLKDIFDGVNHCYFNNTLRSYVRWGSRGSATSYQTTRTSSDGTRWNLITIAGIYNHPLVPQFAIESVMYHEMLHIAIPPYRKNGRNIIHSREFKQIEQQFPYYNQWREWERVEVRKIRKDLLKKR